MCVCVIVCVCRGVEGGVVGCGGVWRWCSSVWRRVGGPAGLVCK